MIITPQQDEKIKELFSKFKETGENGFSLSEQSFPNLKIYFKDAPAFIFANIMEIDGIQVYLGSESENASMNILEEYGDEETEIND